MLNLGNWLKQQFVLPFGLPLPQTVKLPSGNLEYVVYGSGKPLLLLHGGVGGYDQSLVLFKDIIPEGFQLICPSRPGYLGTSLESGKSVTEQTDLLVELLDFLAVDTVGVVAMSAGGMVAYDLALRYPDKVRALVAISAISGEYLLPEQASNQLAQTFFMPDLGLWLTKESLSYFPEMTIRKFINASGAMNSDLVNKKVAEIMNSQQEMKLIAQIMCLMADYNSRSLGTMNDLANGSQLSWFPFNEIKQPALVIHGTHDNEVRFHHGVFAYEGLGSSHKERIWLEYGSHFAFYFPSQHRAAQQEFQRFLLQYA